MKEQTKSTVSEEEATNGPRPASDRLDEPSDEVTRLSRAARRWIDEYPLLTLGAVVFTGWVVGRMLRR